MSTVQKSIVSYIHAALKVFLFLCTLLSTHIMYLYMDCYVIKRYTHIIVITALSLRRSLRQYATRFVFCAEPGCITGVQNINLIYEF